MFKTGEKSHLCQENLHTSVKILQICMDLQDSVQRSLQNPAEKILQICTDSQRSKTWEDKFLKRSKEKKGLTGNLIRKIRLPKRHKSD